MRTGITLGLLAFLLLTPAHGLTQDNLHAWESVLKKHVRASGVDYKALLSDKEDRARLDGFVAGLAKMNPKAPLHEWINAYNAIVVFQVLKHAKSGLPPSSVRDVPGFFDKLAVTVAGKGRTLDEIENKIIRVRFPDARVHAALNCAAKSCPRLHSRAFRKGNLDSTLAALAKAMVKNQTHVRKTGDSFHVSEIFFWFENDFKRDAKTVQAWIRKHGVPVPDGAKLVRIPYDWSLNQAR